MKKGCWCQGGHPVLGDMLPLSIPPEAMDQGLFGELSMQPVTLLSPCVLQYPNLATQLTQIQISFAEFITILLLIFKDTVSEFSQVSVVVASGLRLFFLQSTCLSWLHQIVISCAHVLPLSVKAGMRVNTRETGEFKCLGVLFPSEGRVGLRFKN